jgi:hypothetical protein
VATPVALSDTHTGVVGPRARPHGFLRLASWSWANPFRSDTRLVWTYSLCPLGRDGWDAEALATPAGTAAAATTVTEATAVVASHLRPPRRRWGRWVPPSGRGCCSGRARCMGNLLSVRITYTCPTESYVWGLRRDFRNRPMNAPGRPHPRCTADQQIRGSGSPTSMSTIRVPPIGVSSTTSPGGSRRISPMAAASLPKG